MKSAFELARAHTGAIKNQEPTEGSGENARAEEEDEGAARDDALPHAL